MHSVATVTSLYDEGPVDPPTPSRVDVHTRDGACAVEWSEQEDGSSVRLLDASGATVLEYRPGEGTCRIVAGRVEVKARRDLELSAERRVRIRGERGVELLSGESRVAVEPDRVALSGDEVRASARRLEWSAELLRLAGDQVETTAKLLVQRVGQLDTVAERIVERTRDAFREAEGLAQTRAGRLRLVAEGTFWAMARRALWRAEEDVTVRGERIYLE